LAQVCVHVCKCVDDHCRVTVSSMQAWSGQLVTSRPGFAHSVGVATKRQAQVGAGSPWFQIRPLSVLVSSLWLVGRTTRYSGQRSFARRRLPRNVFSRVSQRLRPRTCRRASGSSQDPLRDIEDLPVLVLSGFLGTGKTTLLKHWLEKATSRIGVVVNDVAAINVDAALISEQTSAVTGNGARIDTIQLENGCACCSQGEELIFSIMDLLKLGGSEGEKFSHMVVELSGVAEPNNVVEMLKMTRMSAKVVTVIDTSTFCTEYMEYKRLDERADLLDDSDPEHMMSSKVVELLVEQVEAADVVVLNKTDLADGDDLRATKELVEALNSNASVLVTSFGKITLDEISKSMSSVPAGKDCEDHDSHAKAHSHEDAHSHSSEDACNDPDCTDPSHEHSHAHSHAHSHGHEGKASEQTTAERRFGIGSFVYKADRPFCRPRLDELLSTWPVPRKDSLGTFLQSADDDVDGPFSRVLRSKGFCWLDEHPASKLFWSHAGKEMGINFHGLWWDAFNDQQKSYFKAMKPAEYEKAQKGIWSEKFGDRRQELVFIGQHLNEIAIREALDACLLKDDELDAYMLQQAQDKAPPVPLY